MFNQHIIQTRRLFIYLWAGVGLPLAVLAILLARPAPTSGAAAADVNVCGSIATNTTWIAASSPYTVTCDVQVMSGVTLTIQSGVAVKFNAGTSLLVDGTLIAQGCTFTSGKATPARDDWGRIFFGPSSVDAVFDAGGNYVRGSLIQDCLVEWGGGGVSVNGAIETNLASSFIDNNTIRNNGASGIYATGRSSGQPVVISHNSVSNNIPGHIGGGVYVSAGRVISNTISSNTGFNGGGGIYAIASTVTGNNIIANSATNASKGGGIYAVGSTLIGNTVSGNTATNNGGGIYAEGGTVSGNTVSGNTGNDRGGGIYASVSTITGNSVNGNTASRAGGIYAGGGTVVGNIISGNTATLGDGGGVYGQTSTVQQNTFIGNSANQGGAIYATGSTVTSNTILTNTTVQNGTLYMDGGTAIQNIIQGNTAGSSGGGIYVTRVIAPNNANVTDNTVTNNTANFGGGIYATNQSTLNGNTVMSNTAQSDGGGIYADRGALTNNIVSYNTVPSFGRGSGVYLVGTVSLSNNSILTNTASGGTAGGISLNGQPQNFQYNNLYGNQPYDAEVITTTVVTGTLNYWGPVECTAIAGRIYDGNDAPGRGQLVYAPSLYSSAALAQLPAPTSLGIVTNTSSITLTWSAIPAIPNVGCRPSGYSGPDAGYRVYYDSDGCPPYTGQGLPSGASPINAGATTILMLTGVAEGEYHFVVAAYDYLGRESAYSNEVVRPSSQQEIYLPLITKAL